MTINRNNAHVKGIIADASKIAKADADYASTTGGVWVSIMLKSVLARGDKASGLAERDDFTALLKLANLPSGGSHASERWSVAKCGALQCHKALVKNLSGLNLTPTSLYDVACYVRGTGPFAKAKEGMKPTPFNGKGLGVKGAGWGTSNPNAPTVAQLKAGIVLANKARNWSKLNKGNDDPQTAEEWIAAAAKKLKAINDKGPKAVKREGKEIVKARAAFDSDYLRNAVREMHKYLTSKKLNVVTGGKAKAA